MADIYGSGTCNSSLDFPSCNVVGSPVAVFPSQIDGIATINMVSCVEGVIGSQIIASSVISGFSASQENYHIVLFLIVPLWCVNLYWSGMYRSMRLKSGLDIVGMVANSALLTAIAFSGLVFILKLEFISRLFFILFMVLASLSLIFEKAFI